MGSIGARKPETCCRAVGTCPLGHCRQVQTVPWRRLSGAGSWAPVLSLQPQSGGATEVSSLPAVSFHVCVPVRPVGDQIELAAWRVLHRTPYGGDKACRPVLWQQRHHHRLRDRRCLPAVALRPRSAMWGVAQAVGIPSQRLPQDDSAYPAMRRSATLVPPVSNRHGQGLVRSPRQDLPSFSVLDRKQRD